MSFFADKSPREVGRAGVAFLQQPILKRSTSLPVSELTRLFVEGDKRRNEVSVSFRCCDYTAVQVTIVRNAGSGAPLLDFHLEGKIKLSPIFDAKVIFSGAVRRIYGRYEKYVREIGFGQGSPPMYSQSEWGHKRAYRRNIGGDMGAQGWDMGGDIRVGHRSGRGGGSMGV